MDKIRENAFGIGVGILGLGAAILFYYLILHPIFNHLGGSPGSARANLEDVNKRLSRYKDSKITEVLPTNELLDAMTKYKGQLDNALQGAVEFYIDKNTRFKELFEDFIGTVRPGSVPDTAAFKTTFVTRVDELRKAYLEAYPRKPPEDPNKPPADPNKPPDDVLPDEAKRPFEIPDHVLEAMKHYWILEAVFAALHQHQIGGLKSITFPPPVRGGQPEAIPPQYRVFRALIRVDLPMTRIEPFLATLYKAEKVPFELETLTIARDPDTVIQELVIQKEYDKAEEAAKDTLPGGEPPVSAEITLRAIEWLGFPKEPDPKANKP